MVDFVTLSGQAVLLFVAISILYRLSKGLWCLKLGNLLGFGESFKPKENSWAIITGSTDGIGLAYAHEFIKKGYNLLLISRSHEKLAFVQEELKSESNKCNKEVRIHVADFSKTDIYQGIQDQVEKLPRVDVLINNVGMSYEHPEYFASDYLLDTYTRMINVNSVSCSKMCYMILPRMESQKYGVILNIASFSAVNPAPLLAVYAATKAFMDVLTRSISYEYQDKGIIIQSVLPGFVTTKMSKMSRPSLMVPTTQDYVKSQLKTVGLDRQTTGYWSHELQYYVTQRIFPVIFSSNFIVMIIYKQLATLRGAALRRKQRMSGDNSSKRK